MISRSNKLSQLMATTCYNRISVIGAVGTPTEGRTNLSLIRVNGLINNFRLRKACGCVVKVSRMGSHAVARNDSLS